jgi:hypothetical protein
MNPTTCPNCGTKFDPIDEEPVQEALADIQITRAPGMVSECCKALSQHELFADGDQQIGLCSECLKWAPYIRKEQ